MPTVVSLMIRKEEVGVTLIRLNVKQTFSPSSDCLLIPMLQIPVGFHACSGLAFLVPIAFAYKVDSLCPYYER